ncbi:hypothetical protein WMY93_018259 [Mugilogobius chulae]|uniref:Uncharacterized protein n=1 Tax=Mugilogobius chulae TaxID=88201 RepID=A0AAW0NIC7_9GOBI
MVSPQGYYQFKEERKTREEELHQDSFEVNPDFEGFSAVKLTESLSMWVHHTQHILQQGRCTWVNLTLRPEELNEEAEEEREMEPEEVDPEQGPPLLTPLSQDAELFNTPPWTLKLSSKLTPEHAVAFVRSNLWPGAYAYATGKKFENIYIGWGLKYAGEGTAPCASTAPGRAPERSRGHRGARPHCGGRTGPEGRTGGAGGLPERRWKGPRRRKRKTTERRWKGPRGGRGRRLRGDGRDRGGRGRRLRGDGRHRGGRGRRLRGDGRD